MQKIFKVQLNIILINPLYLELSQTTVFLNERQLAAQCLGMATVLRRRVSSIINDNNLNPKDLQHSI